MNTTRRILHIEDDLDDQCFLSEAVAFINPDGIIDAAASGADALEIISQVPVYDIIFLDLHLPKMDGFEFLVRLKDIEHYKDVPVIVLTTSWRSQDIERCEELGVKSFLTKPYSFKELLDMLKPFLSISIFEL